MALAAMMNCAGGHDVTRCYRCLDKFIGLDHLVCRRSSATSTIILLSICNNPSLFVEADDEMV